LDSRVFFDFNAQDFPVGAAYVDSLFQITKKQAFWETDSWDWMFE
jgi:hypothetical protein